MFLDSLFLSFMVGGGGGGRKKFGPNLGKVKSAEISFSLYNVGVGGG